MSSPLIALAESANKAARAIDIDDLSQVPAPVSKPQLSDAPPHLPEGRVALRNPGKYDEAENSAKNVLGVEPVEGAKLTLDLPLAGSSNKHAKAELSVHLANPQIPNGAHVSGEVQVVLPKEGDMLFGRYDNQGQLVARYIFSPIPNAQAFVQFMLGEDPAYDTIVADASYRGSDYSISGRLVQSPQSPQITASYMQAVTPVWAVGTELIHQLEGSKSITGIKVSHKTEDDYLFRGDLGQAPGEETSASINTMGSISLNYFRRINRRTQIAADLDWSLISMRSTANVGFKFTTALSSQQAVISTDGVVSAVFEVTPNPLMQVQFSGVLDHAQDKSKVGVAFKFGQAEPKY